MRHALPLAAAITLLIGGAVYAQEQTQPSQPAPQGNGMMGNGMMGNQEMMSQMTRMMKNCNRMMESYMRDHRVHKHPEKNG
jgi:hypothetical protein